MEAARTQGHELHVAFVDLSKAYDSVSREGLWSVLERFGVPPKMLSAVKQLHEGMQATVEVEGQQREPFPLESGVKQGSGLSPLQHYFRLRFVESTLPLCDDGRIL